MLPTWILSRLKKLFFKSVRVFIRIIFKLCTLLELHTCSMCSWNKTSYRFYAKYIKYSYCDNTSKSFVFYWACFYAPFLYILHKIKLKSLKSECLGRKATDRYSLTTSLYTYGTIDKCSKIIWQPKCFTTSCQL